MRNLFFGINTFSQKLNKVMAEICGWLLVAMTFLLCIDIVGRAVKSPFQGTPELAIFVMLVGSFLGLGFSEQLDRHVNVTFFLERMPDRLKKSVKYFNAFGQLIVVILLAYASYNSLVYALSRSVEIPGVVPFPLWPVRLGIFIGVLLYVLQSIVNIINLIVSSKLKE